MSIRHDIGDAAFRFKLYFGVSVLGGFISAIFYPLYLFDFPDADLIQISKIVSHVFQTEQIRAWTAFGAGAGLALWLVWMVVARPWRGGDAPPEVGSYGLKKPW